MTSQVQHMGVQLGNLPRAINWKVGTITLATNFSLNGCTQLYSTYWEYNWVAMVTGHGPILVTGHGPKLGLGNLWLLDMGLYWITYGYWTWAHTGK